MRIPKKDIPTQQTINNYVVRQYESIEWLQNDGVKLEYIGQLYSCSAYIYRLGHLILLKSYYTFVAAFDTTTNELFDFLRYTYGYTATSTQHISKFAKYCVHQRISFTNDIHKVTYYPIKEG